MAQPALMAGLVLAGITLGAQATPAEEIKVETLTPRPRTTLPMLVLRADKPVASVVLFAGGDGKLGGFRADGTPALGGNFLVRTRSVFLSQGPTVAVMDVPSDSQEGRGLIGFRQSAAHMQDVSAVMRSCGSRRAFRCGSSGRAWGPSRWFRPPSGSTGRARTGSS
jgi:hypothetical protein